MKIKVNLIDGQTLTTLMLDVISTDTVGMVKNQVEKLKNVSLINERVMFGLNQLTDKHTLGSVGIIDGSTITILRSSTGTF